MTRTWAMAESYLYKIEPPFVCMSFPLLFQVISWGCCFTPAAPSIVYSVLRGRIDWPVISAYTLHWLLSTIHACGSIQFIPLYPLRPTPPFSTGFIIAFIFQAVETLLATSSAVSNVVNSDTGRRTVDPCPGREVTSPLPTILSLESPTTSQR